MDNSPLWFATSSNCCVFVMTFFVFVVTLLCVVATLLCVIAALLCFVTTIVVTATDRRDGGEGARAGDKPNGDVHHGVWWNGAHRAAANARQQQHLQQGQNKYENTFGFSAFEMLSSTCFRLSARKPWMAFHSTYRVSRAGSFMERGAGSTRSP